MYRKAYVEVTAKFTKEGAIVPTMVLWQDGTPFEVDKVLLVEPRASLKVGGAGLRYTCRIQGKETFLFLEENRWFVEAKC